MKSVFLLLSCLFLAATAAKLEDGTSDQTKKDNKKSVIINGETFRPEKVVEDPMNTGPAIDGTTDLDDMNEPAQDPVLYDEAPIPNRKRAIPSSVDCDFDSDDCRFTQETNDTLNWTRRRGSTPSSPTGPSGDHTSGNGYYMYIETSSGRVGDNAKLSSPKKQFSGNNCIIFYYHMYGYSMGRLNVIVNGIIKFTKSGNQGNKWLKAEVPVTSSGMYEVTFEGIRGSSYTGDIAIDDIRFINGSCPFTTPVPTPHAVTTPVPTPHAVDGCQNYTVLSGADRAQGNTVRNYKCDRRDLRPGWYRFQGAAGDKMLDKCVPMYRCGTTVPGWLNGTHPTAAEGVVNRKVCYHWSNECCRSNNNINVKNCGAYYVYELQRTPTCNFRYCGNADAGEAPTNSTTKPTTPRKSTTPSRSFRQCSFCQSSTSYDDCQSKLKVKNCTGDDDGCFQADIKFEKGSDKTHHFSKGCLHKSLCAEFNEGKIGFCKSQEALGYTVDCKTKCCTNGDECNKENILIAKNKEVNVTCGKNEMTISIPKRLLPGVDRDHLRLTDLNCSATEKTTYFYLHTKLNECHTKSRHTKDIVCYMNKVEEIPVVPHQIITRVREVEIPFSCCYLKTGLVVSAVGLQVKSSKIVLRSKKGNGKFVLEMKISPNSTFNDHYEEKDYPVSVSLREKLFVEVCVDTDDRRLAILAEECFATPDSNPDTSGLRYTIIKKGCATDETVTSIPTDDERCQRFEMETFNFIGDNPFVYLHCNVTVCNATDPNSRCAQGCLHGRRRRSLYTHETNDEEYNLVQGPFMRSDAEHDETDVQKTLTGMRDVEKSGQYNSLIAAMAVVAAVCLVGVSYFAWDKKKRSAVRDYKRLSVQASED